MGLGYSIEQMGNELVGKDSRHIVTEGLAIGMAYIAIRVVFQNFTNKRVTNG